VLQVYRASVDAPVHAVGGQIWREMRKKRISSIHCIKLTPKQVEIYLERLLKKLSKPGIRKLLTLRNCIRSAVHYLQVLGMDAVCNRELQDAAEVPELANLQQLWFCLDAALVSLETQQQLQVAGDAISKLPRLFLSARC